MTAVDRVLLNERFEHERQYFVTQHPKSRELSERAKISLLEGVPMNWRSVRGALH